MNIQKDPPYQLEQLRYLLQAAFRSAEEEDYTGCQIALGLTLEIMDQLEEVVRAEEKSGFNAGDRPSELKGLSLGPSGGRTAGPEVASDFRTDPQFYL